MQETQLRAWRSYSEFDGRSSTRSWLYQVATNVCPTGAAPVTAAPRVIAFHDPPLVATFGFPDPLAS